MKVDFSTPIRDFKGNDVKERDGSVVTLASIATQALSATYDDEKNLKADDKYKRFKIAILVCDGGEVELSVEHVAELKKLIGKGFGPLVVGRAYEALDPPKTES